VCLYLATPLGALQMDELDMTTSVCGSVSETFLSFKEIYMYLSVTLNIVVVLILVLFHFAGVSLMKLGSCQQDDLADCQGARGAAAEVGRKEQLCQKPGEGAQDWYKRLLLLIQLLTLSIKL